MMPTRNTRAPILCDEKDANRYVSRAIPWVLLAIVAYASYAVTKPLCIDYLIHPQSHYNRGPRIGAGVAIIVVFYVLLFPAITTYIRLYFVVAYSPDYLPRGTNWVPPEPDNRTWASRRRNRRKGKTGSKGRANGHVENTQEKRQRTAAESADIERQAGGVAFPLGEAALESFWMKDIFVCQDDGRPAYCSKCSQFKTDRSHHNRDVDRCVRKLDHFCPWVGGVVSESSYKFFLQFLVYTAVFTCFCLIVFAYFVAEHRSDTGRVNAQWVVALGLAALFFLFSAGMSGTSLHLSSINSTTIENLSRRSKVWTLAVYISPDQFQRLTNAGTDGQWALTFPTVTFPVQQSDTINTTPAAQQPPPDSTSGLQPTISRPSDGSKDIPDNNTNNRQRAASNMRTFAILRTQPGENPFDLGDPIKNLQQVMGYTLWDWLLPLKVAPCIDHSSTVSAYPMGPVVDRLKREAGILDEQQEGGKEDTPNNNGHKYRRRHRRHRRSSISRQKSEDGQERTGGVIQHR